MSAMLKSALGRFRIIALAEGVSWILLAFVAMPLKYMADQPMGVTILGRIHGLLFVVFAFALVSVWVAQKWSIGKVAAAFIASLIPFGAFVFDYLALKDEEPFVNEA